MSAAAVKLSGRPPLKRTGQRRFLPRTYPGCWKDREFIRAYNCASEKIRRLRGVRPLRPSCARPRCFSCRKVNTPSGMPLRLRLIARLVLGDDGRMHRAKVLWCGQC